MQGRLQNERRDIEQFGTTCWGTLGLYAHGDDRQAASALAVLCTRYRPVILACIRQRVRSGYGEDPEDLTQGFFVHILKYDLFLRANPTRGRFRAFLLTSLRHYLHAVRDRQIAAKRGGGLLVMALEVTNEEPSAVEPFAQQCEAAVFDRCWAETLVAHALDRLVEEYSVRGSREVIRRCLPYLHGETEGTESYEEAAAQLGLSVSAFRSALNRVRVRHRQILRAAVAETVRRPEEINAEIRYLYAALSQTPQ